MTGKIFFGSLGILVAPLVATGGTQSPGKPNVLLIYSDDHGWADLGAQGVDKDIRTPNLDRLAQDGVRFSRGYVSAPQCVPSRAGVLSGRYQQRFGLEDNNGGPLPLAELTIAERLKPAGYFSGQVGKWHLDLSESGGTKGQRVQRNFMPHAQGFDQYWRGEMREYFASHDLKGHPFADAPHLVADNRFRITVQTEAALSFLNGRVAAPEQPWFLYLAWFAPHVPLESPEPWFSRTPSHLPLKRRQALAMIGAMDDGLGRIRAKLEAMGESSNTLIFFIGDNGAPVKEGAWDGSVNMPLIGEKGMLTDGGVRTPFVAAWPGMLPAGEIYQEPVSSLDVAATAVALAGLPHDEKLDGVNLVPFLCGENKGAPHENLFWRWRSQAAVLEFPWKLIRLGESVKYLFDVTTPDGETKNLIGQHPEIVARLDARLRNWSDTLEPAGLPKAVVGADRIFFEDHGLMPKSVTSITRNSSSLKGAAPLALQGWSCRNGTLAIEDRALVLKPHAPNVGMFMTCNTLDIPGPITATLRIRAKAGDQSTLTWRTNGQADFPAGNLVKFEWPAVTDWQEVKVALPVSGRLIHLRMNPGKNVSGIEIQSIELRGKDGKSKSWRFDSVLEK